jgi:hypothetical protein
MLTSGVAARQTVDLDLEDGFKSTVRVMVHDIKLLCSQRQLHPINPIRGPLGPCPTGASKNR